MDRKTMKVSFSTYRNVVKGKQPDGSDRTVKQYRKAVELAPNTDAGTKQDALLGWASDMVEQGQVNRALEIVKAGSTLVWQDGVWTDVASAGGSISDAKALEYAVAHIGEEKFRTLLTTGMVAEAKALARECMRKGVGPTAEDIDETDAKLLDAGRREHWKAVMALPESLDA
jgi:hypothetical protein